MKDVYLKLAMLVGVSVFFPRAIMAEEQSSESAINYEDFQLYQSPNRAYPLEDYGSGTHFEVKYIDPYGVAGYYLWNPVARTAFVAEDADVKITNENPSCTLEYRSTEGMSEPFYFAVPDLEPAIYNVSIDFEGEKATLTFTRTEEYWFNHSDVLIKMTGGETISPIGSDETHTYFERVHFTSNTGFFISELEYADAHIKPRRLGWASEEETPLSPSNLSTQAVRPCEAPVMTANLDGWYYVTLTWNEDNTVAEVSLSESMPWQGVGDYTGDIYIFYSRQNHDTKLTCVEPGVYEWSGERLDSGFILRGPYDDQAIPESVSWFEGTGIPLSLGMETFDNPEATWLVPGEPMALAVKGAYIRYQNPGEYIADAKLRLNLKEMTLTVDGTLRASEPDSGVGAIEADIDLTEPVEVYDLGGVKVGTATEGLPKGVYILKQGAKRVKIAL